jgi:hypothetical protein
LPLGASIKDANVRLLVGDSTRIFKEQISGLGVSSITAITEHIDENANKGVVDFDSATTNLTDGHVFNRLNLTTRALSTNGNVSWEETKVDQDIVSKVLGGQC